MPVLFKKGDRVRVDLPPDELKILQDGHGGWNPKMAEYIGKIGTVTRLTDRGDIGVQYQGCANRWTFNAVALKKVQFFNIGDIVTIINDAEKVKESQKGHGEWTDNMRMFLGKTGEVLKVYPDGDVRVCINEQTRTFNPECCIMKSRDQQELDNRMASHEPRADSPERQPLLEQIMGPDHEPSRAEQLIEEAAQGHVDSVTAADKGGTSDSGFPYSLNRGSDISMKNHAGLCAIDVASTKAVQRVKREYASDDQAAGCEGSQTTEFGQASAGEGTEIKRLRQLEQQVTCPLCVERRRDTAFDCGHTVCSECAKRINRCSECRKLIAKKLQLYC